MVGKLEVGSTVEFAEIMECLNLPWDQINLCYDEFITNYAKDKETVEVLADLEAARSISSQIENNCHPLAHAIGRYTLLEYENVGDAFDACDFTCHSGCYHGVMERLFFSAEEIAEGTQHLSLEQLQERVPGICDESQFANPSNAIIFQCLHGLGHALLYTLDYDLEGALAACDTLETHYDRSSCYGGVVMENVTAFERDKRYIDPEDPLYPCNALEDKYQYSCYQMQTSIMFELGLKPEEMSIECLGAGAGNAEACFTSIGRDLSNEVRAGNSYYVAGVCELEKSLLGDSYAQNCIEGTIYALIDNTWDTSYAFPFCNVLEETKNQSYCFDRALSYLDVYDYSHEAKIEECENYAEENLNECLSYL